MKITTRAGLIGAAALLLIIFALGSIVISREERHIRRNRDIVLHQNLWAMRRAIDFYTVEKGKAPKSLEDVVANGYLLEIPIDPITKSNKTWTIENQAITSESGSETGITDVHSGGAGADANGRLYNQY